MTERTELLTSPGDGELASLPREEGSRSELLAASHLFTVEIRSAVAEPWAPGEVGVDERKVDVLFRVMEVLKGTIKTDNERMARGTLLQKTEGDLISSQYLGIWSYVSPEPGVRLFLIADANGSEVDELIQEPPLMRVLNVEQASDAYLALTVERQLRGLDSQNNPLSADEQRTILLDYTKSVAEQVGDLYVRYFWVRMQPLFSERAELVLDNVIDLLRSPGRSDVVKAAMLLGLDDAILELDESDGLEQKFASGLVTLLTGPASSSLSDLIVDTYLYNLVFNEDDEGRPVEVLSVQSVIPAASLRLSVANVFESVATERSLALLDWSRSSGDSK